MRRVQESPTLSRRARGPARRVRALPEGFLGNALTLAAALAILLAGFLAAINIDRLLPSGKGMLAVSRSRNQLDESWLQGVGRGASLQVFPYDGSGTTLEELDKDTALPALLGIRDLINLSGLIVKQWTHMPDGSAMKPFWSAMWFSQYDDTTPDISAYLRLEDIQEKARSLGAYDGFTPSPAKVAPAVTVFVPDAADEQYNGVTVPLETVPLETVPLETVPPGASLNAAQYACVLKSPLPGLVAPERWLLYRVPIAWYQKKEAEDVPASCIFIADGVHHASRGLVHLFLHEPGQSFPVSFTETNDEASLQYIKAQAAAFLDLLLNAPDREKNSNFYDKRMVAEWHARGNTRPADTRGLVSVEADACYVAGNLFAVSFPCEGGGRILLYVDAATMSFRGFTRQYTGR